MSRNSQTDPERSIRRHARVGMLALLLLIFGVGGWSALASIRGAVIAPGLVVVETSKKRVQHAEGGIVEAIHVAAGVHVEAGDMLFELDGTRIKAELQIIGTRLFDAEIKHVRLRAERDSRDGFVLPASLLTRSSSDPSFTRMVLVQHDLLAARQDMRRHQQGQHREQIERLRAELLGHREQQQGRRAELKLIRSEIKAVDTLTGKGLALRRQLNDLRRQEADAKADLGRLSTDMARAEGQIKELAIKLADIDTQFENDLLSQLEETSGTLSELKAQQLASEDRLRRLIIRAPRAGFVHELQVHTIGAVVGPGETLLHIVPENDGLIIEAKIRPVDIDQVALGQDAEIRFPTFNTRTTPSLAARIHSVSADQSQNEQTGESYYTVRLRLEEGEAARIKTGKITPGMPAEVLVTSEERTVISYLMKPLSDQITHAFREE